MNHLNQKNLIIGGVVVLALIAIGVGLYLSKGSLLPSGPQEVAMGEPIDIVLDFYDPWLAAAQGKTPNPYKSGLAEAPILSKELRKRLMDSEGRDATTVPDPVLCQVTVPEQISARPISVLEDRVEILVVSRDKNQPEQAIVELLKLNEGWYINNITCSPGEFGPEREFSFDKEGFLLKSVVAPLDPKYWHIVFEENGVQGHVAPLFFSSTSMCVALDESQAVCDPNTFVEPSKAHVQGEMTETGVNVKRVQFLPQE